MLLVATEGVPLIVHVLLSMDRPVGSAGETVHVAPVTLAMPPPEPLLAVVPMKPKGHRVPGVATSNQNRCGLAYGGGRNLGPTAPHPVSPSTSHRRCQGWRRCRSKVPAETATAVRPVPRSIAVEEGAVVYV